MAPPHGNRLLSRKDIEQFFERGVHTHLPGLCVICAVFGFHDPNLSLLLAKWKGVNLWSLPGGYVLRRESLDAAARRVLYVHTGIRTDHLKQFRTFGGPNRTGAKLRSFYAKLGIRVPADAWPFRRIVTVGYYAFVDSGKIRARTDYMLDVCGWYPVNGRPRLSFNHEQATRLALEALRGRLDAPAAGVSLLPKRFTMPELQHLHEAVLGTRLDRRNFQKRMLEGGRLERLAERRQGGAHRAPYLYRFRSDRPQDDF